MPYWRIVVPLPPDPQTKKRRQLVRGFRGTKKEAQSYKRKLVSEVESGKHTALRSTLAELCDEWVKMKRKKWSPTTTARTEDVLRLHVLPALGARFGVGLAGLAEQPVEPSVDAVVVCAAHPQELGVLDAPVHAVL